MEEHIDFGMETGFDDLVDAPASLPYLEVAPVEEGRWDVDAVHNALAGVDIEPPFDINDDLTDGSLEDGPPTSWSVEPSFVPPEIEISGGPTGSKLDALFADLGDAVGDDGGLATKDLAAFVEDQGLNGTIETAERTSLDQLVKSAEPVVVLGEVDGGLVPMEVIALDEGGDATLRSLHKDGSYALPAADLASAWGKQGATFVHADPVEAMLAPVPGRDDWLAGGDATATDADADDEITLPVIAAGAGAVLLPMVVTGLTYRRPS